jgi:hypothetical protein
MRRKINGLEFDLEMQSAGFTRKEISNQRLRNAAYRLLIRGEIYSFDDDERIEHGVTGPFNDIEE